MASFIKRGDKYQARVRVKGQSLSQNFHTKRDAQAWAKQIEVDLQKGFVARSNDSLSDLIDRYIEEKNPTPNQKTMFEWYRNHMGKRKLRDLRKADFVTARDALKKERNKRTGQPFAPATVNRYSMNMSGVLTVAVEEWFLLENNPARIKQLPENNTRDRILTDDEQERLITACEEVEEVALLPFVLMVLGSGARAGELLNLRWNDVDLQRGSAILRDTKNGDTRTIPVMGYALDSLKNYRTAFHALPIGSAFVFKNNTGRVPFAYQRSWNEARTAAGIPDFKFHDIRHTAASIVAMAGRSLGEVGALLGHRSVQTTRRYAHYATKHTLQMGEIIAVKKRK